MAHAPFAFQPFRRRRLNPERFGNASLQVIGQDAVAVVEFGQDLGGVSDLFSERILEKLEKPLELLVRQLLIWKAKSGLV